MIKGRFFLVFLLISFFTSCDWFGRIEVNPPDIYEGCCDTGPVKDTIGSALIAIPNAISPNDDGVNDYFSIYSGDLLQIKSLGITEKYGNLSIDRHNIPLKRGWTEIWLPRNTGGVVIPGLYRYDLLVATLSGQEKNISGHFCVFTCANTVADSLASIPCFYQGQWSGREWVLDSLAPENPCP